MSLPTPTTGAWPAAWRARWIWWEPAPAPATFFGSGSPPRRPDGLGFLRRSVTLGARPRGRCRLTADGRYVLWVNGTCLGRGPVRSEPAFLTYDDYDLSPHLVEGENVIA